MGWLVGWLVGLSVSGFSKLVGWLVVWLVSRLIGRSNGRLVGQSVGWSVNSYVCWIALNKHHFSKLKKTHLLFVLRSMNVGSHLPLVGWLVSRSVSQSVSWLVGQ
jgi:hypothetical protein